MDIVELVNQFGLPIVIAGGLGYFIFFIWKFVTTQIKPKLGEAFGVLVALIDRIRMLDNDMIRLNTKIQMILQEQEQQQRTERRNRRKENVLSDEL